jgi:hypothetical protein
MIKNFIYLDEYKMYSLSSQIFEGITEYVLNISQNEENKESIRKEDYGVLADILKKGYQTEEKKYLHDYSYTIFEKHLIDKDKVVDINNIEMDSKFIENINSKSFVKIKGKITFNDMNRISNTIENFNEMSRALLISQNPNPNFKDINERLNEKKLNEDFLKSLKYIFDYGFGNQLEIQLEYNNYLFSTQIKRKYLREDESILVKKYSRKTEKEFVVFGIITQSHNSNHTNIEYQEKHMKIQLMNIVSTLTNAEQTFTGKLENEIMIDPIAIYTEL